MYDFIISICAYSVVVAAIFILNGLRRKKASNPQGLPYPPGPKTLPIIGNLLDIPTVTPWITYSAWGKKYGDILHVNVLGSHFVIINSLAIAKDLFEKRSNIYSDRPAGISIEMMGWEFNAGLIPYGDHWRKNRRMFHQNFRPAAAVNYQPTQIKEIQTLLRRLLQNPEDFSKHYRTLAASIVMSTMYGIDIKPKDDQFVVIAEKAVEMLGGAFVPGAQLVNTFPMLRHIPSWMPGAGFKRFAEECHILTDTMKNVPFDYVRQHMRTGTGKPSLLATLLEQNDRAGGSKEQEAIIKDVTATAYAAGADTTVSTMVSSLLAMALHPEAQKKAQAEIDAIIGTSRLPNFEDRESLPYCEAFYREAMRWAPGTPLGVPHATIADDTYNGHFIPKGATVMGNVWAMTRDERVYSNPERFNPERFIDENGRLNDDDENLTFGFGRRVCVGKYMASATVWATIVHVLSVFDVSKATDKAGNEIEIEVGFTDTLVSHSKPFLCSLKPRSEAAELLIKRSSVEE